jgi:hypothetical protein
MPNEQEPIAKMLGDNLVEYVCPKCGWYDLAGVFNEFLPFVDHLIQDYCLVHHPLLSRPIVQPNGIVWFQKPGTNELILGLPTYEPNAPEWKVLLRNKEKLFPEAKLFLPDIARWLERALLSVDELNFIQTSNLQTAEKLVSLATGLTEEFREQRNYLLNQRDRLEGTGMDPKWTGKPGKQAAFIARSMAGARWGLTSSSSREMIRLVKPSERKDTLKKLKIPWHPFWWLPAQKEDSI